MRVYIAAVSAEKQYVKTLESFFDMTIQEGDKRAYLFGRPGWVARMDLCDDFLEQKEYDALLLVDMDMVIPKDALDRLRAHNLDIVTAHYFRRDTSPLMSICQVVREDNWQVPLIDIPTEGLHEVAASGFGFVLISRRVLEAVGRLPRIGHAIGPGLVPETGNEFIHGQDIRFFYYTRELGYKLWLDASVECKHATTMYTSKYLYDILRPYQDVEWEEEWKKIRWLQNKIISKESKNWKKFGAK